jgi:TBC1 domain family protein 5
MAFPLENERPPQERPPWEPRTRFEMERDISQLKARDKQIGDSLGWIVDVLLQDEEDTENGERLKKEKREAIESLAYIRDVLISDAVVLEDDRLVGEEEASRRRARVQRQEVAGMAPGPSTPPGISKMVPPAPLPVLDSRPRATRSHRPLPGQLISQTQAPSASVSAETQVGSGPALAPWHYTRSNFTGGSTLPSATLPRPPPPTSRNPRRAGERLGDQTPSRGKGAGGYSDPLGAIR